MLYKNNLHCLMVERFQIQELIFLDREGNKKAQFFSELHIQAIA